MNEGHLDDCVGSSDLESLENDMLEAQAALEKVVVGDPETAKNFCEFFLDTYYVYQAMKLDNQRKRGIHEDEKDKGTNKRTLPQGS